MQGNDGGKWRMDKVEVAYFYTNRDTDQLIAEVESIVTETLEGGDRRRAMQKLRVPPLSQTKGPWTTFRVGFFSGLFITLIGVLIVTSTVHYNINHFIHDRHNSTSFVAFNLVIKVKGTNTSFYKFLLRRFFELRRCYIK